MADKGPDKGPDKGDEASPDLESHPGTEAFVPDFDTGEPSVPFVPDFDDDDSEPFSIAGLEKSATDSKKDAKREVESKHEEDAKAEEKEAPEASVVPVTVPGRYQYLKWWKFVLVVLGVWLVAGVIGLALFYWWFHTVDKTWPVFAVLVYVVACSLAGVLLAMVQARPMISALSIAVMSGPFAAVAAAAPLYGYYFCERTGRCLLNVIPY